MNILSTSSLHQKAILSLLLSTSLACARLLAPPSLMATTASPNESNTMTTEEKITDSKGQTFEYYQKLAAEKFHSKLTIPQFESSPEAIEKVTSVTLSNADKELDKIGKQDLHLVAFATTVGALDNVLYDVTNVSNRLAVIKETSQDAKLREAAENALKIFQSWSVGVNYREDVANAIKAFAKTEPKLDTEEAKLLAETLRDYKRSGLDLPLDKRNVIEHKRKELTALTTDFESNIVDSVAPIKFTKSELEGLPDSFLNDPKIKTGKDEYTVKVNETYQFLLIADHAKLEKTRKKAYVVRDNIAREKNVPLFNKILALRNDIALSLGYPSWADYQIEIKMAKSSTTATQFISDLIAASQPKFDSEVKELHALKAADTNDPKAIINSWDWRYYANQIQKTKYNIDSEALRAYFPLDNVLKGMFKIYAHDFNLQFFPIKPPYQWVNDLMFFVTCDATSGEPLGLFYLDMFPREGKYNHFAEFGIIDGKLLDDGFYQRPVNALICNFPPPTAEHPSLLAHDEVVTVFHEFGHALHGMLTRAKYGEFAGTNVPGDFVEAPSQMLEYWTWNKAVLDSFAADYKHPSKKIPADILNKLKEADLATAAMQYRRQFSFAKLDLALHSAHNKDQPYDCVKTSNDILQEVFLPIDPDTAFIASFGHLAGGYDAGYYGYAWADVIAADMATVFADSKEGFFDQKSGMKLRTEIYEPGNSRDVNDSIEKFLGRKVSNVPFLKSKLGLQK